MKIPLFDIDWTLLIGDNQAHNNAFKHAFLTIYGVSASIDDIEHHGMTDRQVIIEVLRVHGIPRDTAVAKLAQAREAMVSYFEAHQNQGHYVPLEGVSETLEALREAGIPCGVLTGNTEPIAWHKLERAGIRHFLTFGAFGDVSDRRVDLITIAQQRCREAHPNLEKPHFAIIGDSPRDIRCARDGGIEAVAVATGKYGLQKLGAYLPDLILRSLTETEPLLRYLRS